MEMNPVLVKNADRMMTSVISSKRGIGVAFADGKCGRIPFDRIPEIEGLPDVAQIELPNPYVIVLKTSEGETIELPWDFARHYCDPSYRPRVEAVARSTRQTLGDRVRQLRRTRGLSQAALASAAGIGRVTLIRVEKGEYLPRFATMEALAGALGVDPQDMLADRTKIRL